MSNIEWGKDDVCYADGLVWKASPHNSNCVIWETNTGPYLKCRQIPYSRIVKYEDFQLNEPRQGDYLQKSQLGTEQKYNAAVEVFGLFGFEFDPAKSGYPSDFKAIIINGIGCHLYVSEFRFLRLGNLFNSGRKISYSQLMAIGKLKRLMNEREDTLVKVVKKSDPQSTISFIRPSDCEIDSESKEKDTKASKAYNLLKSMDIYYDEDLKLWYKKEFL